MPSSEGWPPVFSRDWWLVVNTFAGWISAIGTVAAVITALYLARKESRIRLKVIAGVRLIGTIGTPGPPSRYAVLEVINVGRRQATVTGLYFRDGLPFTRTEFVWVPPQNSLSAGMPVVLGDGGSARWVSPIADFADATFRQHFAGWRGWVRAPLFRAGITTSAGGRFERRIEKSLRDDLRRFARGERA